jgi:hypothetical protein
MEIALRTPTGATPQVWTGRVISGLVIAFLLFDSVIKLMDLTIVQQTMIQLGYPIHLDRMLGVITLVCAVLYAIPRTSVLGAVLLTGLLGGAIATHVRVDSPLFSHVLFGVYLGVLAWAGLYLRDERLRAIFPLRV